MQLVFRTRAVLKNSLVHFFFQIALRNHTVTVRIRISTYYKDNYYFKQNLQRQMLF
jgi:hypothetical protein